MVERLVVGAMVWSSDNRLLLGKRSERLYYAGLWQLPGGGVEAGESMLAAVARELREETGLEVVEESFLLVDGRGNERFERKNSSGVTELIDMRFMIYETRLERPSSELCLQPSDEFEELRWFSNGEIPALELVPAGLPLFRRLGIIR